MNDNSLILLFSCFCCKGNKAFGNGLNQESCFILRD